MYTHISFWDDVLLQKQKPGQHKSILISHHLLNCGFVFTTNFLDDD